MQLDLKKTIPAIFDCVTLHRIRNFGTEEYAYFRYIEDRFDSLPGIVSFIQGGGLTENPHLIYDIMADIPGLTYKSLSRHVRDAWHMIDYEKEKDKTAEKEIMDTFIPFLAAQPAWIADWRGMFALSRDQIRRHPWQMYYFINESLGQDKCLWRNCNMEVFFSSIFGCNPHLFDNSQNCTKGVYANTSNTVFDEDFNADGVSDNGGIANEWHWHICGNKSLMYSTSQMNGGLICLDQGNRTTTTPEGNRELLLKVIAGDTRRADYSNEKWKQAPQWGRHKEISDQQI